MESEHRSWSALKGARVLVVDDDPDAVKALRRVLEEAGAEVSSARDVRSAQETIAREEAFDAAVVDYFLIGGQHGKVLLRPLREQLVSTLMISGVERDDVANQAISAGADDFMLKPFEVDEFLQCVQRLVAKTRSWREKITSIRLGVRPPRQGAKGHPLDAKLDAVVDALAAQSGLTSRERDVMRKLADSLTNEQIAEQLGIAVSTVKYHDNNARRRLGLESRDELRQLVMKMVRTWRSADDD